MSEKPPEKTCIERIRDNVNNAPTAVEAEFERTDNIWLDCFTSRIFQIETYLEISKERNEGLSEEQYQSAKLKLEELKEFHRALLKQYPNKDTVPPDDVKAELFKRLNILGQEDAG